MPTTNDTTVKAAIEKSTGVTPRVNFGKPSDVKREAIEAYPCYAPLGGITFRVHRGDNPALWLDATISEAESIIEDIEYAVRQAKRENAEFKDVEDAKKSIGAKPLPSWWEVGKYDASRYDKKWVGKVPVNLVNIHGIIDSSTAVWFATEDSANEIVDRLNKR